MLSSFSKVLNQISPLSFTIKSTDISGVTDIDSQTLSVVFPKMQEFSSPRAVFFIVDIDDPSVEMVAGSCVKCIGKGHFSVATEGNSH